MKSLKKAIEEVFGLFNEKEISRAGLTVGLDDMGYKVYTRRGGERFQKSLDYMVKEGQLKMRTIGKDNFPVYKLKGKENERLTYITDFEILPYNIIVKGFNGHKEFAIVHAKKTGHIVREDYVHITNQEYKELKRVSKGKYIAGDKKN
jgi:hypothetical protein